MTSLKKGEKVTKEVIMIFELIKLKTNFKCLKTFYTVLVTLFPF